MRVTLRTLTFKISLFVVLVLLVSLIIFSLVFIFSERNKLSRDIISSGENFANFSTQAIYNGYIQYYTHPRPEDFGAFKGIVERMLVNNRDIVGISLLGVNGRVLFDSGEFATGKYSGPVRQIEDKETLQIVKGDKTSYREIKENGQDLTEIIVPIYQSGGHLFSMRYLVSQELLAERMNEVYWQIILTALPLLILVSFFAVIFTISITRPLRALTKAAEKIQGGNFDVNIEMPARDEIGRLAAAFNVMALKLKESYGMLEAKVRERTLELEGERGSLEKRVKQRTAELERLKGELEKTVVERTSVLKEKLEELEQMNKHMIGRELKMAEIKEELKRLKNN